MSSLSKLNRQKKLANRNARLTNTWKKQFEVVRDQKDELKVQILNLSLRTKELEDYLDIMKKSDEMKDEIILGLQNGINEFLESYKVKHD